MTRGIGSFVETALRMNETRISFHVDPAKAATAMASDADQLVHGFPGPAALFERIGSTPLRHCDGVWNRGSGRSSTHTPNVTQPVNCSVRN